MNNTIDKFIEENRKTIIELETLLSSIPAISPVSGGEGEAEKARALENWLRGRGFDNFTYINAPDERVPSGIRPNLILTVPGRNSGRTLWIMSHLDVLMLHYKPFLLHPLLFELQKSLIHFHLRHLL